MTKTAKAKTLAKNYVVPQSREEADKMIRELGETRRRVDRIEADMNDELARVKEKYEQLAEADKDRSVALLSGIQDWCSTNRDQITNSGKVKFARFKNGEIKWRRRPPKVSLRGVEEVIRRLKRLRMKHGLARF